MAQLRDAQTSELLAEGTPADLVLLADRLGPDRVIFDGVPVEAIDLDAIRQRNAELVDELGDDEAARQDTVAGLAPRVTAVLDSAQNPRADTLPPVDVAAYIEG